MQKIILIVLFTLALLFAGFLRLLNRPIPLRKGRTSLSGRFWLGVTLFAALFGCKSVGEQEGHSTTKPATTPQGMSATTGIADRTPGGRPGAGAIFRELSKIWRAMNATTTGQFKAAVGLGVAGGHLDARTGTLLVELFDEVASHKARTRGPRMTKCYKQSALGGFIRSTREAILKRVESLRAVAANGKLDSATAQHLAQGLALDVERWRRGRLLSHEDYTKVRAAITALNAELKQPTAVSSGVARAIVQMETGLVLTVDHGPRLTEMKRRTAELFLRGPALSDWNDPDIRPNVKKILADYRIIEAAPMVSCYDRMASPVAARSTELQKLRKVLLNQKVSAGVLDEETGAIAGQTPPVAYAAAGEVAAFQKRVRRLVRFMVRQGELPSDFVKKVEAVVGLPLVRFSEHKRLVNDVSYYLRASFYGVSGGDILAVLEMEGVVRAARNHRGLFATGAHRRHSPDARVTTLARLIRGKTAITLPQDAGKKVQTSSLPKAQRAYRLKVRRAARALLSTGLAGHGHLKHLEPVIGVSLFGALED